MTFFVNQVPSIVASLLELASPSDSLPKENEAFHSLLRTLKLFISHPDGPGCLPLTSTLPDMRTDTESYVQIQRMYKEQARLETVSHLSTSKPALSVTMICASLGSVQTYIEGELPRFHT